MSLFTAPPKPATPLGWHRVLSPTAAVKMETRGNGDQMVIATKYSAPYRVYNRDAEPIQSNLAGNSAKSMHISVRDSLKKLRTTYIDILNVHWWELAASVEEVFYLGVSDTPAWVVMKASDFARRNGLTPFSVYQGRWCASRRDVESEIIPICEGQGMAFMSWGSLGGGLLATAAEREKIETDMDAPKAPYGFDQGDAALASRRATPLLKTDPPAPSTSTQALAYLLHQSTYVIPIVGVQTVEYVKAMPDALRVGLSTEEIDAIQNAAHFSPLFPNHYYFHYENRRGYNLRLTGAGQKNYRSGAWIDTPLK
ncbi:hypothetical protein ABOM_006629 [Aspergillus bombycis]|uniref:NADP-dependent oxidoreductase domain-containing protein n=1 Tax=Aspergillus bombycis TaxID=109264 RepID=A0A1F8A088_9EURO|nr:hypothetical protein ABOM_006629 [Aspergillus bombycis]OGM45126.1 hypothetical protein ABOM_006629 [Aspergillus bombycis]